MNSNVHGSLFSVFPLTHIFVMVNSSDNYGTNEACVNRNIFIAEYIGVTIHAYLEKCLFRALKTVHVEDPIEITGGVA